MSKGLAKPASSKWTAGSGVCSCGCGLTNSNKSSKFIPGHYQRMMADKNPEFGNQFKIRKILDAKRKEEFLNYILRNSGKIEIGDIARISNLAIKKELPRALFLEISKFRKQSLPQYERLEIPGEYETEINLLCRSSLFLSLDNSTGSEIGREYYESIASESMTPLESLISKEESEERRERMTNVDNFNTFLSIKKTFPELLPKIKTASETVGGSALTI